MSGWRGAKKRNGWQRSRYMLLIAPALLLGVLAMRSGGVSPGLWGQQAAALVICALLLLPGKGLHRVPAAAWAAAGIVMLAAALLGPEAGGARRWVALGPLNVNAAMLVLPSMLIMLYRLACPYPAALCAAAVLSIQPDVSQLAAFAAAALPALWHGGKARHFCVLSAAGLAALLLCCLRIPTAIEPAVHSEGVMGLLGGISPLLQAAGYAALAVIPAYWAWRFLKERQGWMLSFAVYYGVTILFGLSGAYPTPFMGFGLSPVAGYALAAACLTEHERSETRYEHA